MAQSPESLARQILSRNTLCVLASASPDGKPEAATIEYAEEGFTLYFETFPSYRKYKNLKSNPRASIVVTEVPHTIQMDGTVEELEGKEVQTAKNLLTKKHGKGSGFYEDPDIRFFRFSPSWIRILVEAKYPPKYAVIRDKL